MFRKMNIKILRIQCSSRYISFMKLSSFQRGKLSISSPLSLMLLVGNDLKQSLSPLGRINCKGRIYFLPGNVTNFSVRQFELCISPSIPTPVLGEMFDVFYNRQAAVWITFFFKTQPELLRNNFLNKVLSHRHVQVHPRMYEP